MGVKRNEPILTSTEAQLFVADIEASCAFSIDKLGFTVAFVCGNPPYYGQIVRDQARLNVRAIGEPVFAGNIRPREELFSASLTVSSAGAIEQLFQAYQAANVHFAQQLQEQPRASTLGVSDPMAISFRLPDQLMRGTATAVSMRSGFGSQHPASHKQHARKDKTPQQQGQRW